MTSKNKVAETKKILVKLKKKILSNYIQCSVFSSATLFLEDFAMNFLQLNIHKMRASQNNKYDDMMKYCAGLLST